MSNRRNYPITPAPDDDPRFSMGLIFDVSRVLEQHGYPPIREAGDLVDLHQMLFRFLYVPRDNGEATDA